MHANFSRLLSRYTETSANNSSYFVWIDEPEIIIAAVKQILNRL
ncbi:MAG: hypothetical protein ACFCU5_17610 [Pleurocapsa sp.]